VEEALDSFVADADVVRQMSRLRVLYFLRGKNKTDLSLFGMAAGVGARWCADTGERSG
jgi:hypothetical protein